MARGDYVFVHIWDNNANVYGSYDDALVGITEAWTEDESDAFGDAIRKTLDYAREHPGEAAVIDEGMSTVRYLSVTSNEAIFRRDKEEDKRRHAPGMKTFVITETCTYKVDAETEEQALDIYLDNGPDAGNAAAGVSFMGVQDRTVEEED